MNDADQNYIDDNEEMEDLQESLLNPSVEMIQNLHESPYAKKSKTALHSVLSTKENSKQKNDEQTLIDCIPSVIDEMRKIGLLEHWISFNQMLARREFPLNNIAFLLFMDVCKFLSNENSSAMRYSDKVKQFWKIGHKLFHGKWLRVMGGPKHRSQVVVGNTEKGNFKPAESEINFAVPRRAVVSSELSPLSPENVKPGILHTLRF